jgi:hypothetical protein
MKPVMGVAEMMRIIKASSSRWIRERVPGFRWQTGYAAFSVSETVVPMVKRYVLTQEEHHRQSTFAEEMAILAEEHGLELDPWFLRR